MKYEVKNELQGFPWWSSGEESASQCGGHRFYPWSGKIPHATGQLSSCTTSTEPRACAPQREKPAQWDALVLPLESNPCSLQLEKACAQQRRPSTAKNKQINIITEEYFLQDDLLFFSCTFISYSVPTKQLEVREMLIKLVEWTLFHSSDTTFLLKHYIFPGHFGGGEGKGDKATSWLPGTAAKKPDHTLPVWHVTGTRTCAMAIRGGDALGWAPRLTFLASSSTLSSGPHSAVHMGTS